MKINIRTYLSILLIVALLFSFYLQTDFGALVAFYLIIFLGFRTIFIKRHFYYLSYFIIFLSFLFAYFIRAFILIPHPDLYTYPWIEKFSLHDERISKALWEILFYFILVSFGFLLAVKLRVIKKNNTSKTRGSAKGFFAPGWPIKYFSSISILMGILVALKLLVFFITGAGMKAVHSSTSLAFLLRFIPDDLIFIIVVIYFVRYRTYLSPFRKRILYVLGTFMSLSILLTGSKIFLMLLGLCVFIVYVYEGRRLYLSKLILFSIVGVVIIAVSFTVSAVVKYKKPQTIGALIDDVITQIGSVDGIFIVDQITQRFIGLDGYLAAKHIVRSPRSSVTLHLQEAFSVKNILSEIIERTIPFFNVTNSMDSGKAVSVYVNGLPEDYANASALGLFGAFEFILTRMVWLLSLFYGWLIGKLYVWCYRIKDADLRLIIFYFISYFVISSFMSGNMGFLLSLLIIKVILLFVYLRIISFIRKLTY